MSQTLGASGSIDSACADCAEGFFASSLGSSTCIACPPGSVASTVGAASCTPCGKGTVAGANNATCWPCEEGHVASYEGALACEPVQPYIVGLRQFKFKISNTSFAQEEMTNDEKESRKIWPRS